MDQRSNTLFILNLIGANCRNIIVLKERKKGSSLRKNKHVLVFLWNSPKGGDKNEEFLHVILYDRHDNIIKT